MTPAEKISNDTWNWLKHSRLLDTRLGEETLTDLLLLNLKAAEGKYGIRVFQTTKRDEAIYGTDFEILVRAHGNSAWPYVIQAKKLYNGKYKNFRQKSSARPVPSGSGQAAGQLYRPCQLDLLEFRARQIGAIPYYILYNFVDPSPCSTSHYWHCPRYCDDSQFGCTLAPSWIVRKAIRNRRRDFEFVHKQQESRPWRCLFDCPDIQNCGALWKFCTSLQESRAVRTISSDLRTDQSDSSTESTTGATYSYDWIPREPKAGAWPEQLPDEHGDETAFIQQYFESQDRHPESRPRRLLLFDPELYRRSEPDVDSG